MSRPLLEVRRLVKHYPVRAGTFGRRSEPLRAVDGVSFALEAGETFGLVGESGCGKTTLGRALLRLVEPDSGQVRLDGREITALAPGALKQARKHMQMIFQDPYASLSPRRTVAQTLREPLDLHRIGRREYRDRRVAELLDTVGLSRTALERYPHEFSGGQRQRIAVARALAVEPKLIVADEAVSALDVSIQSQVLNLLTDLQHEFGIAYVFISHDLSVVRQISHRVGVMYLGKLVETAPIDRLYAQPAHPYTRALLDAVPRTDPERRPGPRALAGEPPSAARPPPGCAFHPRCPRAMPVCARLVPRTIELGPSGESHRVRCHLHDPEADQVETS